MSVVGKLDKDGAVTVDGKTVGKVVRREIEAGRLEVIGTRISMAGGVVWDAFDADGKELETGIARRRDAVDRVAKNSEPLTVKDVRTDVVLGTRHPAVTAWVRWKGNVIGVSRTVGEAYWRVNYIHEAGAIIPRLSTGTGHGGQIVKSPEVLAALDAAVEAADLASS